VIGFIVFGLFVGVVARLLLPGRQRIGLLWTLILGLIGSVAGGTIASYLGTGQIFELNLIGAIAAILSSLVLLAIGESMGLGAARDRRRLGR
jgi:uncharacterized membrane protein YeaQ/YmgE (transglycosylase-associated protein family)